MDADNYNKQICDKEDYWVLIKYCKSSWIYGSFCDFNFTLGIILICTKLYKFTFLAIIKLKRLKKCNLLHFYLES